MSLEEEKNQKNTNLKKEDFDAAVASAALDLLKHHHIWCVLSDSKKHSTEFYVERCKEQEELLSSEPSESSIAAQGGIDWILAAIAEEGEAIDLFAARSEDALFEYRAAIFGERELSTENFNELEKISDSIVERSVGLKKASLITALMALRRGMFMGEGANDAILRATKKG